jgi:hypothetical protein
MGDCNNDDECEGDLLCYERKSINTTTPGITGLGEAFIGVEAEVSLTNAAFSSSGFWSNGGCDMTADQCITYD